MRTIILNVFTTHESRFLCAPATIGRIIPAVATRGPSLATKKRYLIIWHVLTNLGPLDISYTVSDELIGFLCRYVYKTLKYYSSFNPLLMSNYGYDSQYKNHVSPEVRPQETTSPTFMSFFLSSPLKIPFDTKASF